VRPPSAAQMAEWFVAAWNTIDADCIRKSFQVSFLGNDEELLIGRHTTYGPRFLVNLVQETITQDPVSEDSGVSEIDE